MTIRERYQLALSYKEKSKQDHLDWLELVKKKTFDQTHYDLVKATYDRHLKQSTELCDMICTAQKGSIDDLEAEILALTRQQEQFIRNTAAGKMKPKKANEQGRLLANEKNRIQIILDTAQVIVHAKTTDALGGFIDIPFEEYEEKLEIPNDAELSPHLIDNPKKPKQLSPKNVVLLVLAGCMIWLGMHYYRTTGKASWASEVTDHKQYLRIKCVNTGEKTIRVYTPWSGGVTSPVNDNASLNRISFGILLYVREKGKSEFQLLPETPDVWSVRGKAHNTQSPITVSKRKRLEIKLDTLELRKSGLKIDAVKIVVTRYGGRKVHSTQELLLR